MTPLVSVVLPVCNGAAELDRTLASAVGQTYRNLEILIVDDGSTDATPRLLEKWQARDPRIRCFRQPQSGVASARNRAIAEAKGEFIAPLDHDDVWAVDKIATQVAVFHQANDRLALVSCGWACIDRSDAILSRTRTAISRGDSLKALAQGNYIVSSSIPLIRRAAVVSVGGYSEALRAADAQGCEDYLLYLCLAEQFDFAHVPRVLVGYRTSGVTMSKDLDRMIRSYRLVADEISARHPKLQRLFQPGLVRLLRRKSTRAMRRGEWRQGMTLAAQLVAAHPVLAMSAYATAMVNLLRRLRLARTSGRADRFASVHDTSGLACPPA